MYWEYIVAYRVGSNPTLTTFLRNSPCSRLETTGTVHTLLVCESRILYDTLERRGYTERWRKLVNAVA